MRVFEGKYREQCSIAAMPVGSLGVTSEGHYYFRTCDSAVCLTDVGKSYTGNARAIDDKMVHLIPPGTELTIVTDV